MGRYTFLLGCCLNMAMVLGLLVVATVAVTAEETVLWLEADEAKAQEVSRHNWYNNVEAEQFSQGSWLSHYNQDQPGLLTFSVEVPRSDSYALWIRANPVRTGLAWRVNEGPWQNVDVGRHHERINVAADGNLDHRFIAWINAGTVELPAGEIEVSLRMQGGIANSGLLDCLVFSSDQQWQPRGTARPGTTSGLADEGFVAWDPEPWRADMQSVWCLRHLNEDRAGAQGFVTRQGDQLRLADGSPLRFWTVQAGSLIGQPPERQEWWAQRLASYGVNLVRAGGTEFFAAWMQGRKDDFARRLDNYHRLVAALKEQGIYVYINHLFWNTSTSVRLSEEVFPGFAAGEHKALALLFFSESFQDYYLDFLHELLTTTNPYTGLSLAEDPALAFVELQNESSLLFHTFNPNNLVASERAFIEQQFAQWLQERYGSLAAAQQAWGPERYPHTIGMYRDLGPDDLDAGRMRLYAVAHMRDENWARNQRNQRRAGDQLRFMVEAQRNFYARMRRLLQEQVNLQSLVVASNWVTADERLLGALEHETYTAGDVIARNAYFSTPHAPGGNPRFYRIEVGDRYHDRSALHLPHQLSALHNQTYAGYPFLITENCWNRPNRFRAEFPLVVSAYASLAGLDNWLFFAASDDAWDGSMRVWGINDTTVLGQFPAAALMFRRGDVATADTVHHEALSFDDLYAFQGQALRPAGGIEDPLYQQMLAELPQSQGSPSVIDPLAFMVGRVTRSVAQEAGEGVAVDLTPYIDRQGKRVRSMTGQLAWDYGQGLVTINTPRAQGATGFFQQAGRIELDDIIIHSDNEYGAILVIALDDQPLSRSRSILIQAASEDRSYGFATTQDEDGQHTITRLGGYPLNMRPITAAVTIKRNDLRRATVLDGNGVATAEEQPLQPHTAGLRLQLPQTQLYTWLQ